MKINMNEIFICPKPEIWNEIYKKLLRVYKFRRGNNQNISEPPKPLLLSGWWYSNDLDKQTRWNETVEWAEANGLSHLTPKLSPENSYSVSQISTHAIGPMGGPVYLPWNYEPRNKPGKDEIADGLNLLIRFWEDVIGKQYSRISKPLGFSGKKQRRLKVGFLPNTKSPWGDWNILRNDSSRLAFTEFRKRVNEAIHPLEIDHIDFEVLDMKEQIVEIQSKDYWFKIIEMLQQNWALIEPTQSDSGCIVFFIGNASGVFDQIEFTEIVEAEKQLRINGFEKYEDDKEAQGFIYPPPPPFYKSSHPNGAIYSSGRFWKSG